jgi:hypothetical protein
MDIYLINDTINTVIEKSKVNNVKIWEEIFNNFDIPLFFENEVIEKLNTDLKPRHVRYIKKRIIHIIQGCIDDITIT